MSSHSSGIGTAATRNFAIARGGLHHGKIDAHLPQRRIDLVEHGRLFGPAPGLGHAGQPGGAGRLVAANALQQRLRPPDKHAAVPQVTIRPGGKVSLGRRLVGLLLETLDHAGGGAQRFAQLQVAIARGGLGRRDAERDERLGMVFRHLEPWAMIS